jgi:hypothetical protein
MVRLKRQRMLHRHADDGAAELRRIDSSQRASQDRDASRFIAMNRCSEI